MAVYSLLRKEKNMKPYLKSLMKHLTIFLIMMTIFPVLTHAMETLTSQKENSYNVSDSLDVTASSTKTNLTLNRSSVSILIDEKVALKATITGKRGTVKWSSSKKSVATVSSKGVVVGKKKGTTIITAKVNGVKKTCKVTVKPIPNVDNNMFNLSAKNLAKKVGFGYRRIYGHNGRRCIYSKTKIDNYRKLRESRVYSTNKDDTKKGAWDLGVSDKTITFMGIKLGMTEKQALKAMSKASWKKIKSEGDGTSKEIEFSPPKSATYAYKYGGTARIFIENGKVCYIIYFIDWYSVK